MRHRGRLLEVLRRAETGPLIEERAFEAKLIAPTAKRLIQKYGIRFDRQTLVPHDDDLADRLYAAGLEFAVEVGMFCQDTSRRITWTRAEYEDALRYAPTTAIMGVGSDAVTVQKRVPEDARRPLVSGGAVGVVVPEELFVPLMLSYAQEPVIDILEPASLDSAYGQPIMAASPWEVIGGWREAELTLEVVRRAGRPGMCLACVTIASTSTGAISAASYGGFRPSDWHHCSVVSEFKTNYAALSQVAHAARIGANIESYLNPIYGGFFGGAEGAALALTAGPIVLHQNYLGTTMSGSVAHPVLHCGSIPEAIWAQSLAFQALSRNTGLLISSMNKPAGGPGTKSILYENAALTIANVVSGISVVESCMSASGVHYKHASGLDSRICGEVARAASGMSREQANDIVTRLVALYEPGLKMSPIGRPFDEVYDLATLKPTPEWQGTYDEVREMLLRMGLPLGRQAVPAA